MKNLIKIRKGASVLPTVIVVTLLMTLAVLVVLSYWEMVGLLFAKNNFEKARRADIESGFVLYGNYPSITDTLQDGYISLFDLSPESTVKITKKRWGVYEVVGIYSPAGQTGQSRIMGTGARSAVEGFYYSDNGSSLTLSGNTNIHGDVHIPAKGIIYGQMQSQFFSGEKIDQRRIKTSEKNLPRPDAGAREEVERILDLLREGYNEIDTYNIENRFFDQGIPIPAVIYSANEKILKGQSCKGNVMLVADKLYISPDNEIEDAIIVGRSITVGQGFHGSLQIFSSDTVIVEKKAHLKYPSGIYSGKYAELQDESIIHGYTIVRPEDKSNIRDTHYKQSKTGRLRGLLYVEGNAQLQGIISGPVYLDKALYFSPQGYYKDMLYDVSVLSNDMTALPLWLTGDYKRESIKWIR